MLRLFSALLLTFLLSHSALYLHGPTEAFQLERLA